MTEERSFTTNYESLQFYWIGGLWGYAVMQIIDDNDVIKIRLAKCKKKSGFPQTEKHQWQEVDVEHVIDFSQVNHINFKNPEEFTACYEKVLEEFEDINNS